MENEEIYDNCGHCPNCNQMTVIEHMGEEQCPTCQKMIICCEHCYQRTRDYGCKKCQANAKYEEGKFYGF